MLQEQIQTDLTEALKAGNEPRLSVLRDIKNEITNELVARGQDRDETLDDDGVIEVIAQLAKQRRESIEEFSDGGREELADKEQKELEILQEYLPEPMSDNQINALVEEAITDVGAEGMSDMGAVMGKVMKEVTPPTDGDRVREIVEANLKS